MPPPSGDPPARATGSRRRARREAPRRPLTVLHADERFVAVDKPAGIAVHGGAGSTGPSVLERLEAELGERLFLAHRLDRGTAGVLLLARRAEHARTASAAWDRVEKEYRAVVFGRPSAPHVYDDPLREPDGRVLEARTELHRVTPLDALGADLALCALRIATGRLHQIRRHLASAGHPVVMDDQHGDFEANKRFAEAMKAAGHSKPKHPFLFCRQLRAPAGLGLPRLVRAPWPRAWVPLLTAGGLSVDGPEALA